MFISLYLGLKTCVDAIPRGPESLLTASAALQTGADTPRARQTISHFSLASRADRASLGHNSLLFARVSRSRPGALASSLKSTLRAARYRYRRFQYGGSRRCSSGRRCERSKVVPVGCARRNAPKPAIVAEHPGDVQLADQIL